MTPRAAKALPVKQEKNDQWLQTTGIGILVFVAMVFNAGLAFINAHVTTMGTMWVMLAEVGILGACGVIILKTKPKGWDKWLLFCATFFLMFWLVSLVSQGINPKPLRDMLLIAVFAMLGLCYKGNVIQLFKYFTLAILAVMAFEAFFPQSYAWLLNPAKYYYTTRGVGSLESEPDLFVNSARYVGRFSLGGEGAAGLFNLHRLGAIFLEQTTLANYAVIIILLCLATWREQTPRQRALFIFTVLAILVLTDSRLLLGLLFILWLGYWIFPALPRSFIILVMPGFLAMAWLVFYDPNLWYMADNLPGRINWNFHIVQRLDAWDWLGARPKLANRAADSGYAYLIITQTVLGLLAFWLWLARAVPMPTAGMRRFVYGANTFIAINLAVGATVLSIKTSAPLWFLAGALIARHQQKVGMLAVPEAPKLEAKRVHPGRARKK